MSGNDFKLVLEELEIVDYLVEQLLQNRLVLSGAKKYFQFLQLILEFYYHFMTVLFYLLRHRKKKAFRLILLLTNYKSTFSLITIFNWKIKNTQSILLIFYILPSYWDHIEIIKYSIFFYLNLFSYFKLINQINHKFGCPWLQSR